MRHPDRGLQLPDSLAGLGLVPHPEGGWYRETFRSERLTTIDFALAAGGCSAWHRVHGSDEVWTHQRGGPVVVLQFDGVGVTRTVIGATLGTVVVPAGTWQAAEAPDGWALVGCTVAPAFTFDRFELAGPEWLTEHAAHADALRRWMPR